MTNGIMNILNLNSMINYRIRKTVLSRQSAYNIIISIFYDKGIYNFIITILIGWVFIDNISFIIIVYVLLLSTFESIQIYCRKVRIVLWHIYII